MTGAQSFPTSSWRSTFTSGMDQGEFGLVSGIRWLRCGVLWPLANAQREELGALVHIQPQRSFRDLLLQPTARALLAAISSPTAHVLLAVSVLDQRICLCSVGGVSCITGKL